MAKTRLQFDEIHSFLADFTAKDIRQRKNEVIDGILDYLILSYVWGVNDVGEALGKDIPANANEMRDSIYKKIDGKDFEDRLNEYVDSGDMDAIKVVAETEMHRNYNTAIMDTAGANGATMKTWQTMKDDRVREDHQWLEGISVPIDADFYVGEAHAPAPGMFGEADLDVNCRCYLTVT